MEASIPVRTEGLDEIQPKAGLGCIILCLNFLVQVSECVRASEAKTFSIKDTQTSEKPKFTLPLLHFLCRFALLLLLLPLKVSQLCGFPGNNNNTTTQTNNRDNQKNRRNTTKINMSITTKNKNCSK